MSSSEKSRAVIGACKWASFAAISPATPTSLADPSHMLGLTYDNLPIFVVQLFHVHDVMAFVLHAAWHVRGRFVVVHDHPQHLARLHDLQGQFGLHEGIGANLTA